MARPKSREQLLTTAQRMIAHEKELCFDVAAEHGQMFGNVKHMTWFVDAVADALGDAR